MCVCELPWCGLLILSSPPLNYANAGNLCRGKRGISADSALRLARYFGTSVEFWTGIQSHYDTETAKMALGDRLEREVKVLHPQAS